MVIPLCAAFAAQNMVTQDAHLTFSGLGGDCRKENQPQVLEEHVRRAQEKIEIDRVVEVVRTLPTQSKLVLYSIILLRSRAGKVRTSRQAKCIMFYRQLCHHIDVDFVPSAGLPISCPNLICWA
jgi:cell division control protein 6